MGRYFLKRKKKKDKVHLTSSNYHSNDDLPPGYKLSIATIYLINYKNNDNIPPILTK
jgi:hypothetical protein